MSAKRQPTVLIAYDGSEPAGRAIDEAGWLLGDGRPAILAFVWQPTEESMGILEGFRGRDAPTGPRAEAEDLLKRGAELAERAGFSVDARLVEPEGSTAETLVSLAEDEDVGVMVVGATGRGGVAGAVLGSVSQDIVNDFRRPTLVV
jgi:nucleotide-binding universal stress UspA family protein